MEDLFKLLLTTDAVLVVEGLQTLTDAIFTDSVIITTLSVL